MTEVTTVGAGTGKQGEAATQEKVRVGTGHHSIYNWNYICCVGTGHGPV